MHPHNVLLGPNARRARSNGTETGRSEFCLFAAHKAAGLTPLVLENQSAPLRVAAVKGVVGRTAGLARFLAGPRKAARPGGGARVKRDSSHNAAVKFASAGTKRVSLFCTEGKTVPNPLGS
jgi:hypothetical protein